MRHQFRSATRMLVLKLVAPVVLAMIAIGCSAHIGIAQTPDLECSQVSNLRDDGAPLAVGLQAQAFEKISPSQAEAACRSALKADPSNPTLMFQLGRALSLGN